MLGETFTLDGGRSIKRDGVPFVFIGRSYSNAAAHGYAFGAVDADTLVSAALAKYLTARDLKRLLARKILFTKADGKLYATGPLPWGMASAPPDAVKVLNALPFAEALTIYGATAA